MRKRRPISIGTFPWVADTVYQLATNSPAPVNLQFREEILAEKIKPELREQAEAWPRRVELIARQREDGTWPPASSRSGEGEGDAFFTVVRTLLALHDLGVRKDHEAVRKAVAWLETVQNDDGGFPLYLHHTAFTLWVLASHGFGKTPLAKRTLRYLDRTRRPDSGWLDPRLEPSLAEDEDAPSCAWTTLHVLLALSEYPEQRKSMDVRRAAVFLLDRMFKRNHKSFFGHPDHWRELDYGYEGTACFKWAVPKIVLILGRLGCGPATKEIAELIDFLQKTMRPNGRWGATVEGDDYLTLRVLRALMAVQEAEEPPK